MVGSIRSEIAPSQSQDKGMRWTDEKHNRYLDYLEASFVRQLHSRMDSPTWCTDHAEIEGNKHQSLSFNLHKTSEVSSVPYGQCQKINLGKYQPHPYTAFRPLSLDVYERQCKHQVRHAVKDSSTDLEKIPRLQSQDKNMKRIKSNCYKRSSLEDRFGHHSSDESVAECTDQNFVDDGCQKLLPNASGAKKLKIAALEDTPDGDQIPFGELYSSDKAVLGCSSLEEEVGKT